MHFKNGKLNYDSNTITDKFREFENEHNHNENMDAVLNGKLYSLVSDFIQHVNSSGDLSEKLISELLGLDLEFTRRDSDFEDLPRRITDAIPTPDFSAAADFYRQHFRVEPVDACFKDNENGIFRIDDAAINEVIAKFTFEDDE
jgi:hypothetical protein